MPDEEDVMISVLEGVLETWVVPTVENVIESPVPFVEKEAETVVENQSGTIIHLRKKEYQNDVRNDMIDYAYQIGGMDLVTLIECENSTWNMTLKAYWTEDSRWLCMFNRRWHSDIVWNPREKDAQWQWFSTDWKYQIDNCNRLMRSGTPFYWRNRIINWVKCSTIVLDRFETYGE